MQLGEEPQLGHVGSVGRFRPRPDALAPPSAGEVVRRQAAALFRATVLTPPPEMKVNGEVFARCAVRVRRSRRPSRREDSVRLQRACSADCNMFGLGRVEWGR